MLQNDSARLRWIQPRLHAPVLGVISDEWNRLWQSGCINEKTRFALKKRSYAAAAIAKQKKKTNEIRLTRSGVGLRPARCADLKIFDLANRFLGQRHQRVASAARPCFRTESEDAIFGKGPRVLRRATVSV